MWDVVGVAVLCGTWWAWHCCGGSGNAVWEVVGVTLINHIKKKIFLPNHVTIHVLAVFVKKGWM